MWNYDTSSFALFFKDSFGYSGPFVVPYKFSIFCSSYVKNAGGILIGIALNV